MKNKVLDLIDVLKYDYLHLPLPPVPEEFQKNLNLKLKLYKEGSHGYWLEAVDFPGLVASGSNLAELRSATFDAMLTYFDVPRSTALRISDTVVLNFDDGRQVLPSNSMEAMVVTA
ncbi:hypothetical protein COT54_01385 [Candidatus Collierbacteria bacterium CG09_land_8_20_14_0_10_46_12]|uniref:Uncharacterized protein n=3 Tax=Microgenomates group TaxID=1794810 RepID=A0A2H0KKI5_9BACT|nr:MAG: hypothetical protein COV87_01560 [Candidatus Roizmanbacteria bacterium CG11_big_fil_rev_8_21_14_0_20_37_16]PIS18045.1 MAG: hypothetical protein COT54_01385 [Candidatus Collierbacteria bacterium CG09_land_8_20_14_0_10_46_12]PIV08827.1 MAG: hypothetical protein COS52_00660 [Candidatus Roizmanbacteria bacterium CG03_land_8_20_14_0_80_39_12]